MILQGFNAWMSNLSYSGATGWSSFAPYCEAFTGGGDYKINPLPAIFHKHNGCSAPGPNTGFYLSVGTGDTAVTYEDKTLANRCTDLTVQSVTVTDGIYNITKKVTAMFTNNTSDDITIKEIGLGASADDGVYHYMSCLIARKVLDTPITIHPNETYNFSYAITIREPGGH